MIPSPGALRPASSAARAWIPGLVLLGALVLLLALPPWLARIQQAGFDATQRLLPRTVESLPATIVAIDDRSIEALGQWPWPRTIVADLVREIERAGPAAIGLDMVMSEVDRSSPEHWLANLPASAAELARSLASLPSHDAALAQRLAAARVVVGMAGTPEPTAMTLVATPILVEGANADAASVHGHVARYEGVLNNVPMLERAAAGRGLLSVETQDGVIRQLPLVASVRGTLVPAFGIEMLRVAVGAPVLRIGVQGGRMASLSAGDFAVATAPDGTVRPHYSHRDMRRYVAALDVLQGRVDTALLERKLVLIGLTGLVQVDYQGTPLGERMPGVEIHAQLLENLYDGTLVERPAWARGLEVGMFVLLGALLMLGAPRWRTSTTVCVAAAAILVPAVAGLAVFAWQRLLFDVATPALAFTVLFTAVLVQTLGEAARERRALRLQVQREREEAARITGELHAAQQVQLAMLPRVDAFADDARLQIAAAMLPAREVGGDLYDFFRLDAQRLFFQVGDVAGKGLTASIFMAVSKALGKSAALRQQHEDVGAWMITANREITRENSEGLFVTVFAGVLDLDTGAMSYCNAGHDDPYRLGRGGAPQRLRGGDGPPLCAVDGFGYRGMRTVLQRGDLLVLVTDGITEMRDPGGAMYGHARLEAMLERTRALDARMIVDALREDVKAFAAGAEPADDLTILAIRWLGPAGPSLNER